MSDIDGRYLYDATITLRIRADGMDSAWRKARDAAERADDGATTATISMFNLHHRSDLDGSLRK